jgi:hypothetical protein
MVYPSEDTLSILMSSQVHLLDLKNNQHETMISLGSFSLSSLNFEIAFFW